VIAAGAQWSLLILLAKLGSVEEVGEFALASAIAAPVFMLADLNLRAYLATDAREEFDFSTYFTCRVGAVGLAFITILLVGSWIVRGPDSLPVLIAVAAAKSFEGLSTIVVGLFQKEDRMKWLAGSLTVRSVLSVAAFTVALVTTHRLEWAVVALASSRLLAFLSYDYPLARRLTHFTIELLPWNAVKLARACIPLGLVMMMISLNTNIAVYWIEGSLGTIAVGHFAALLYIVAATRIITNAMAQAASPRLARLFLRGERDAFRKLQLKLISVGLLLGATSVGVILILGEPFLEIAYSKEYVSFAPLLAWLLAGNAFSFANAFLGAGMTATRSFARMVSVNIFSIAVLVGLLVALVPPFELLGAAWAVGLASVAKFAVNFYLNLYVDLQAGKAQ
jgi:O-antigen/teichoic acid export membrane protein